MSKDKETVTIQIPEAFTFGNFEADDFDKVLSFFDWSLNNTTLVFDFTKTQKFDYCKLALLSLYQDFISRNGCKFTALKTVSRRC
jgi:hypothetical protein